MDIKLLLLDLDDTLLNSKGKLSKRTIEAVHAAAQKGVTVAIASGRMHTSLLPYVAKLNTHGPVVSYNGALIKDSVTEETIYKNAVPLEISKEILKLSKDRGVFCQYYTENDYFFENHCDISDLYHKMTGIRGIAVGEGLADKITEAPPKLLIIENDKEKNMKLLEEINEKYSDLLHITRSKGHYIELMNKNVNKGEALLRMCEIYDVKKQQCMAMGDGLNDVEMVENAGIGVAVATAGEVLKNAADIVCESADDDGPAKIIEKYLLNA